MSTQQDTPVAGLAPEIVAALRHDSIVTHEDDILDETLRWTVVVDGKIVAHFSDEEEDAAQDLRGKLERHITKLAKLAKQREFVNGLRDLADFLDEHPEVRLDSAWASAFAHNTKADDLRAAIEAMRPLGVEVKVSAREVKATHKFGPVNLSVEALSEGICEERVEVKEVREHVLPDWARVDGDEAPAAGEGA